MPWRRYSTASSLQPVYLYMMMKNVKFTHTFTCEHYRESDFSVKNVVFTIFFCFFFVINFFQPALGLDGNQPKSSTFYIDLDPHPKPKNNFLHFYNTKKLTENHSNNLAVATKYNYIFAVYSRNLLYSWGGERGMGSAKEQNVGHRRRNCAVCLCADRQAIGTNWFFMFLYILCVDVVVVVAV